MTKQETEGVIKYQLHHKFSQAKSAWNISNMNIWRTLIYQLQLIGQHHDRYLGYSYGNISQRFKGEQFLISGTQTGGMAELCQEHYSLVEASDLVNNTVYSSGPCKPSSEALSHASVYSQDQNIKCIIHAHSPEIWHATEDLKFACIAKNVAYGTPDMAYAIERLFQTGQLKDQRVFTMLGHEDGVISFGKDFQEATFAMITALVSAK